MNKFEIFVVEEKYVEKLKKNVKKVTLQQEGRPYPYKMVTVWPEYSQYDKVESGVTVTGELDVKDSGTPNPKSPGNNYQDRTLRDEKNPNGTEKLDSSVSKRLGNLESWAISKGYEFPTAVSSEDTPEDDINPDDIPF